MSYATTSLVSPIPARPVTHTPPSPSVSTSFHPIPPASHHRHSLYVFFLSSPSALYYHLLTVHLLLLPLPFPFFVTTSFLASRHGLLSPRHCDSSSLSLYQASNLDSAARDSTQPHGLPLPVHVSRRLTSRLTLTDLHCHQSVSRERSVFLFAAVVTSSHVALEASVVTPC